MQLVGLTNSLKPIRAPQLESMHGQIRILSLISCSRISANRFLVRRESGPINAANLVTALEFSGVSVIVTGAEADFMSSGIVNCRFCKQVKILAVIRTCAVRQASKTGKTDNSL
jgi:hypothetical protein